MKLKLTFLKTTKRRLNMQASCILCIVMLWKVNGSLEMFCPNEARYRLWGGMRCKAQLKWIDNNVILKNSEKYKYNNMKINIKKAIKFIIIKLFIFYYEVYRSCTSLIEIHIINQNIASF